MYTAIFFTLFLVAAAMAGLFVLLFITKKKEFDQYFEDFKDVIDIDKETIKYHKRLEEKQKEYEKFVVDASLKENNLKFTYAEKKKLHDQLLKQVTLLEDKLDDLSYGLYEPHFHFDTSERYKIELNIIREQQKAMIRAKLAATCDKEWEVGGSKTEGKKMIDRQMKLMLRAFNGECDAAVLKVSWNNVQKMRERVAQAFQTINKMGEPVAIDISPSYLELKLKEISLAYEYQEKIQAEKEEQRRIREEMREEEKARREIEKAIEESIREEQAYEKALDKARHEMETAHGEKLEKLKTQMAILEEKLKAAEEKAKRAQSMAEQTKSGHVYIISNIGSFGENIYKIGLTRRLEPEDRVRELGDASVPFEFDIHAMIYSENAPELETKFHKHFRERQVNLINPRKEFFKVSLNEIEEYAKQNGLSTEFTKLAEAREYRETLALLLSNKDNKTNISVEKMAAQELPASL